MLEVVRQHAASAVKLTPTSNSLLKNEPQNKLGIKNKGLAAAFDTNYLEQVLLGKQVQRAIALIHNRS